MKNFFKFTFASLLGFILGILLLFLIVFKIVSSSEEEIVVKENSLLQINLAQAISDRGSENPFENFNFQSMESETKLGLYQILESIKKAATDDNIKGIYMNPGNIQAGIATVEEIRDALIEFKEKSGKFIICYADAFSQNSYYLATVADKIYLNPEGGLMLLGLKAEIMFYKKLLDKARVEVKIIRHGSFKSAGEPFMYDKMSDANRTQYTAFLTSIWEQIVDGIAKQRNIPKETLNSYIENFTIRFPEDAVKYKLVDGLKYKDDIIAELKELSNTEKTKDLKLVSLKKYIGVPESKKEKKGIAKDKIAIIFASGSINMGKGDSETIGSENISKAIRKARLDDKVKAIVLRINSPGGSALASEIILREVLLAKKVKPVIASMGDVAASGGYYIACAADTIVASENTITGSIGVFGMFMNLSKGLEDYLGITIDGVKTNKFADLGSMFKNMSAEEEQIIQNQIDDVYDTFISHVSKGRHLKKANVDSIGQGRVWSGSDAMQIGLIDVFGGLEKSIQLAAEKANLDNYRIISLPEQKETVEQIIEKLTGNAQIEISDPTMKQAFKYIKNIEKLSEMQGIQARMPYFIEIK